VASRPSVLIVAGEVSGDHHAAQVIEALRRHRPEIDVRGAGGPRMAAAGADVMIDSTRWGVIGFAEAYARLPVFAVRFYRLVHLIERLRPDLLLLIDFPGMNRELVARFSSRIPTAYFFPPQTYGRRSRSASRMAQARVRILAVLPVEEAAYRRAGADVVFVGHPAVDAAARVAGTGGQLRAAWGIAPGPLIGLLPGSRPQELLGLLGPMLDAAKGLRSEAAAQFVLPLASSGFRRMIERRVARSGLAVHVLDGSALDVMAAADAIIVASGTATAEAACVGVPMVVVYRVSLLTEWIARHFMATPDTGREGWSIPSIVLGRPAVPELIQGAVTGPRIRAETERILFDRNLRAHMLADLAEVRRRLGPPGAVDRAAVEILSMLDSQRRPR
jgi:lipid-A-disaccharide synthase